MGYLMKTLHYSDSQLISRLVSELFNQAVNLLRNYVHDSCRFVSFSTCPSATHLKRKSPSVVGVRASGMLVITNRREKKGNKAKANTGRSEEIVLFEKYVD